MAAKTHRFTASIAFDTTADDGYMKHYVALPAAVARALAKVPRKRVVGSLGETRFRRSLQKGPEGELCLRFGVGWLRDAGLEVGAVVDVTVGADPDPDAVDLPEELARALAADPEAMLAWEALTPGKRRTLVYPVARAKRPATREKRAAALVEEVRAMMGDLEWLQPG